MRNGPKSNKEVPCKNCITHVICRNKLVNKLEKINELFGLDEFIVYSHVVFLLFDKCSIIDNYYNKSEFLTISFDKLISEVFNIKERRSYDKK